MGHYSGWDEEQIANVGPRLTPVFNALDRKNPHENDSLSFLASPKKRLEGKLLIAAGFNMKKKNQKRIVQTKANRVAGRAMSRMEVGNLNLA